MTTSLPVHRDVTAFCAELEGRVVAVADNGKWVALQITGFNGSDRWGPESIGKYQWVWPSDLDVTDSEHQALMAELRAEGAVVPWGSTAKA